MQTTEMELGSLYFLKLEDYEKSRQHFEAACAGTKKTDKESGIAAGMAAVSACLAEKTLPEEELKQALEQDGTSAGWERRCHLTTGVYSKDIPVWMRKNSGKNY